MGTKIRLNEATFACYSKVCAPPPAGRGGSSPKGKTSISYREAMDQSSTGTRARLTKERQQREEAKVAYARKQRRKAGSERWSIADAKAIINDMISRRK